MTTLLALVLSQPPAPVPVPNAPPPPVKVAGGESGPAGKPLTVRFDTAGDEVQVVPIDAVEVIPGSELRDGKSCKVLCCKEGQFRLVAYSAVGGRPTPPLVFTVTFGKPPTPPGPVTPPAPGPVVPPVPTDPLAKALYDAYANDPLQPDRKRMLAAYLAETYRFAAEKTKDPAIVNAAQMLDAIRESVATLLKREGLPDDTMVPLRRAIGDAVNAALTTNPDAPFDAATRGAALSAFARVAAALDQLK